LRSAGFNHVDLEAARDLDLTVARVPRYSPEAVAEHTVGLIMALNRKIHRAYARIREGNFSLDGLLGFNLHEQTVGIVGMGHIGSHLSKILKGFGCRVLAHDPYPSENDLPGVEWVELNSILSEGDIISLHCPLYDDTYHLIDTEALARMKRGVMLINTSRGALIDTQAVVQGLKSGKVGALGLDVYEEEADIFFEDYSEQIIMDDLLARLLTFPNVLITGHQGFFTRSALQSICETTLGNIAEFEETGSCRNRVEFEDFRKSIDTR
jgi:D-lactate dehydrogenase